ncbi:MAG TPA: GGDEF domain-containing protein, partial [Abditibacteriaceae bacterium]
LTNTTTELCRELRESKIGRHAAVLIVVPSGRKTDRGRTAMINGFIDAGADDFFAANAPDIEILSRVRCLAGLARVRSDLENAREQLRLQMQNDDLTKLLNRRFFFQAAHRECGRARRYNSELSCLMIEIDHFKRLTSMLGFECGDVMLRAVSGILRDYTRDSDIVARFDEEKFVIILPETDINGAMMLREKIQRAVQEEQLMWHDKPLPLSISLGEANRQRDVSRPPDTLSPLPEDEASEGEHVDGIALSTREELAELLESADAALFVAKRGVRFPSIYVEPLLKKKNDDLDSLDQLPSMD